MIVDLSRMKTLMFRWAIGNCNTTSMNSFSADGFVRFLHMAKMSILSFQRYFSKAKFLVFYNGPKFDYFHELFGTTSPSLVCPVTIINAQDYKNPYHFRPDPGVWWKWVPFRDDTERTEIHIDTDIICLGSPNLLVGELHNQAQGIALIPDRCTYFCEDVCGNFWDDPVLQNRIPINCGFAVFKPGATFEQEFYAATQRVQYGKSEHSYFLDEQGCFNVGLYNSNLAFSLLPRSCNIYAPELRDRLAKGVPIETCHFIADSKDLFYLLEPFIFRKIYDQNFTQDDFFQSVREILDNYRYSGSSYGTTTAPRP